MSRSSALSLTKGEASSGTTLQVAMTEFGVGEEMSTDTDAWASSLGHSDEHVVGVMEQRFASCVVVTAKTLVVVEFSGAAAGTWVGVAANMEVVVDLVVELPCQDVGEDVALAGSSQ